ncbi:MAG: alpha/beta fold hydrolase [Verrucomicrobiota bacterium]
MPSPDRSTFLRRHLKAAAISSILAIVLAACGLVLWAGTQIASPTRRPLMDYHLEFLSNPAAHGLRIDRFTASDGTPCLVCSPSGTLGDRGVKIRQQLTARGVALQPFGKITGNLVLTHGRKGRKEDYLPIAERLCAVGFRCVIPDLPAHGEHPVNIATYGVREAGLPARVLDEASRKFAFEKQPAGLLGMSMGGSVAVHAAARSDSPWQALVVISSFDSFPAAIEGQVSRHIGTTLGPLWASAANSVYHWKSGIALSEIQPRRYAASIYIPTFIAHVTADRVVPMVSGWRLFESLPDTTLKKWQEIPGADHDNVLITSFPIYADIAEWMLRSVPDPQPQP